MDQDDSLRDKALLALEEVVQECRYEVCRRTISLRFVLAWLWSTKGGDRQPYVDFWRAVAEPTMWRMATANHALGRIYQHLGASRSDAIFMSVWKSVAARRDIEAATKVDTAPGG